MVSDTFAIVGAKLIDGTGRPPIERSTVLIENSRIVRVGRQSEMPLAVDLPIVDADGRVLLPGLIDAHAHVGAVVGGADLDVDSDELDDAADEFMAWFHRYGITATRCTGMPDTDRTFQRLKASKPTWPRFVGSGQNLDGEPGGPWPGLIALKTEDEARAATARLAEQGADFVKTYVYMTPPLQLAVVQTAHALGLRVATHAGYRMTVEQAVICGVDALEHIRVGRELVPAECLDELDRLPYRKHDDLVDWRAWRYIDPESEASTLLIERLLERGVVLTPTLVLARSILFVDQPGARQPPGTTQLPEAIQRYWAAAEIGTDYTDHDFKLAKLEFRRQLEWLGRAYAAGVPIVAGTDTPTEFLVPGESLHDELLLLVEAGLRPIDAIAAATGRASELMHRQNEYGTVAQGKYADLLLLNADPLADIRNTRQIQALWKGGVLVHGDAALDSAAPASAGQ